MPHDEAHRFYGKGKNMIDIREHFKKSMLLQYYESEDSIRIPENVFLKILDDYMKIEWLYNHDEEQCLNGYIPQGEPYDRERAIACAEKRDNSMDSIIYTLGNGFWLIVPLMLFEAAVLKFGVPLWNKEKPWGGQKCYQRCPLGDFCNCSPNMIFFISNKKYCMGQLYMNNKFHDNSTLELPVYDDYELYCLTTPFNKLQPPDREPNSILIEIWYSTFDYSRTVRKGSYALEYSYGIFAPKFRRRNNKFFGGNVIPFL